MALLGNYFIDSPTLAGATTVFTNSAMVTPAADGWYSDGTTVREQVAGILGIIQVCPSCSFPCGTGINAVATQGIYSVTFDATAAVGCTILYFDPQDIPDGIRVSYFGDTYNHLTSITEGYLASASPTNYTYLGLTASDCGIAATLGGVGYAAQNEYDWNGASFDLVGITGIVTGVATDVNLTTPTPGYCTLYIPKNAIAPQEMTIEVFSPCGGSSWDVEINCPILLTSCPTSESGGECSSLYPHNYYNVPNRGGVAGEPAVNEFYVLDAVGNSRVPAGNYTINPPSGQWQIVVDANGIITSLVACA
jgi:hypothetical protein